MELPPMEWCEATFPSLNWTATAIAYPLNLIRTYAALLEAVVAQWERGDLEAGRPANLCPLQALSRYVSWSGTAAQQRLQQLIGMTEAVEKHAELDAFYTATNSRAGANET